MKWPFHHRHKAHNIAAVSQQLQGIHLSSSAAGLAIPLVYGQARVPSRLIHYKKLTLAAGNIWNLPAGADNPDRAAIAMAMCEGPITGILQGWDDKDNQTAASLTTLGFLTFLGTLSQAAWAFLTTNYPSEAVPYVLTAYMAHPQWPTPNQSLANYSWEVQALLQWGGGIVDSNPRDIIYDFLTDPNHGVGISSSLLDAATIANFRDYCTAAGIFLSPVFDTQRPAAQHLQELLAVANSAFVWSDGKLKIVPYGDQNVTGNGVTFTANVTPAYNLTDDDFIAAPGTDPVRVLRRPQSDVYNMVKLEFDNRSYQYNGDIAEAKDQNSIELYGLKPAPVIKAPFIKDPAVARLVAQLALQRQVYIRNTYEFTLPFRYVLLEPMDLVTLTDTNLGLSQTTVRLTAVDEQENGTFVCTAEEWPFGVATAAAYGTSSSSGIPTATPTAVPVTPGITVSFDATGQAILNLVGDARTAKHIYVLRTDRLPTLAETRAGTTSNFVSVSGLATGVFVAPGHLVFVGDLAYNSAGGESPLATLEATREGGAFDAPLGPWYHLPLEERHRIHEGGYGVPGEGYLAQPYYDDSGANPLIDPIGMQMQPLLKPHRLAPYNDGNYALSSTTNDGFSSASGVKESGGKAINRLLGKALAGDPDSLDGTPEGTTYNRPLATAITSGQIDLSKAGVIQKYTGNITRSSGNATALSTIVGQLADTGHASTTMQESGGKLMNRLYAKVLAGDVDSLDGVIDGAVTYKRVLNVSAGLIQTASIAALAVTDAKVNDVAAGKTTAGTFVTGVLGKDGSDVAGNRTAQRAVGTAAWGIGMEEAARASRNGGYPVPGEEYQAQPQYDASGGSLLIDPTAMQVQAALKSHRLSVFNDGNYAASAITSDGLSLHGSATDSTGTAARQVVKLLAKALSGDPDTLNGVVDGLTYKKVLNVSSGLIQTASIATAAVTQTTNASRDRCRIGLSGTFTVSANSNIKVPFPAEVFDVGSLHDTVTNNTRITIPVGAGGVPWLFGMIASWANNSDTTNRKISLWKNNAVFADGPLIVAINGNTTVQTFFWMDVPADTDYFEMIVWHNAATSVILDTSTLFTAVTVW